MGLKCLVFVDWSLSQSIKSFSNNYNGSLRRQPYFKITKMKTSTKYLDAYMLNIFYRIKEGRK